MSCLILSFDDFHELLINDVSASIGYFALVCRGHASLGERAAVLCSVVAWDKRSSATWRAGSVFHLFFLLQSRPRASNFHQPFRRLGKAGPSLSCIFLSCTRRSLQRSPVYPPQSSCLNKNVYQPTCDLTLSARFDIDLLGRSNQVSAESVRRFQISPASFFRALVPCR